MQDWNIVHDLIHQPLNFRLMQSASSLILTNCHALTTAVHPRFCFF